MYQIVNGSTPVFVFLLTDATDDETAETGQSSITVQLSKNGGNFANVTNAITEIGSGFYKVTLTASETNTDGPLIMIAEKSGVSNIWRWISQVYTPTTTFNATITGIGSTMLELIADAIWRRKYTDIKARASGSGIGTLDIRSPLGMMAKLVNKIAMVDTTLTIYHEDDSTSFGTQNATVNASASPVTGLDTN